MTGRAEKTAERVRLVGDGRPSHPKDAGFYLVDGDEQAALIDTGAGEVERVRRAFRRDYA